jgi:hypothetical protein
VLTLLREYQCLLALAYQRPRETVSTLSLLSLALSLVLSLAVPLVLSLSTSVYSNASGYSGSV